MAILGGCMKGKHGLAVVIVLAVVIIAGTYLYRHDKLNRFLPEKLRHKTPNMSGFIGLTRSGQMTMAPGGAAGIPGVDLNSGDWV